MALTFSNQPGSGNKSSRVPKATQIALDNFEITTHIVKDFQKWLEKEEGLSWVNVEISHRNTKNRLGTAMPGRNRVILYRHSAWILLHEISHIHVLEFLKRQFTKGNVEFGYRDIKSHGKEFGATLAFLTKRFFDYTKEKNINIDGKADIKVPKISAPTIKKADSPEQILKDNYPNLVGAVITADDSEYMIIGFKPRNYKFPFIAENGHGKLFKLHRRKVLNWAKKEGLI